MFWELFLKRKTNNHNLLHLQLLRLLFGKQVSRPFGHLLNITEQTHFAQGQIYHVLKDFFGEINIRKIYTNTRNNIWTTFNFYSHWIYIRTLNIHIIEMLNFCHCEFPYPYKARSWRNFITESVTYLRCGKRKTALVEF